MTRERVICCFIYLSRRLCLDPVSIPVFGLRIRYVNVNRILPLNLCQGNPGIRVKRSRATLIQREIALSQPSFSPCSLFAAAFTAPSSALTLFRCFALIYRRRCHSRRLHRCVLCTVRMLCARFRAPSTFRNLLSTRCHSVLCSIPDDHVGDGHVRRAASFKSFACPRRSDSFSFVLLLIVAFIKPL
jgi:hypothetical protein